MYHQSRELNPVHILVQGIIGIEDIRDGKPTLQPSADVFFASGGAARKGADEGVVDRIVRLTGLVFKERLDVEHCNGVVGEYTLADRSWLWAVVGSEGN
jgi:hypothetical protein